MPPVVAAAVAAVVAAVVTIESETGVIGKALTPDMPDISDISALPELAGSDTYSSKSGQVRNTIAEGVFVALCYGKCKIGGNQIRFNDPDDSDLRAIVGHCRGPVGGIARWEINDIEWSELTGAHTKTEYTGTRTQTPDARFSDRASAYRSMAYTAFTFVKNDRQTGTTPRVTVIMEGLLCAPLAGGADAFIRNPAVILYDWYLNVEGYAAADLDLNAFKSLEALCDEIPSGSSLPRYRFDFNFDVNMTVNDAKKIIWQSFNGRVIMSQGKLKPVWDSGQMADGSGGLTAKTVSHAFTEDNIVKNSFAWNQPDRPNIVRIYFKDSDKNYKNSSVEMKDEHDISINGEILHEEKAWYITHEEIANRRCKFKFNKFKYADYETKFTGFSDSGDLELYDLVTVTHTLPGFSAKQFLVTSKSEDQYGRPNFILKAYYTGVYDDSQVGVQASYESTLPNPYIAYPVTSVSLIEGGEISGDGTYIPFLILNFTEAVNNTFFDHAEVYISTIEDGAAYNYYGDAKDSGYKIEALAGNFKEGDTVYIKLVSVNRQTATKETMPATYTAMKNIQGKSIPPSDVTNFSVAQMRGDLLYFSWDALSHSTDADLKGYEIRYGFTWKTGTVVVKELDATSYLLSNFTAGSKIYWIKAIDNSNNYSINAVYTSISATRADQNIIFERNEIYKMADAAVSQISRFYRVPSFKVSNAGCHDDDSISYYNDDSVSYHDDPSYLSGTYTSESIDVGSAQTSIPLIEITSQISTGAVIEVEIDTSNDDISWDGWQDYKYQNYSFRYLKVRITITVDKTTYPHENTAVEGIDISIDVPDVIDGGADVVIAVGGTTTNFAKTYSDVNSIKINVSIISSTAKLPTTLNKTVTGFDCKVFDTGGNDVGGTIDWESRGY